MIRFTARSFSGIPYGQFLNSLAIKPFILLPENFKVYEYKTFIPLRKQGYSAIIIQRTT